jgi:apolipoprotein N-acyltransferase
MTAIFDALIRCGDFVRGLVGWRRFLFAFGLGLLTALAFAPFGLIPFLLIGFAALVLFIDGAAARAKPIRNAAYAGWAFGFGQFLAGLYWVGYAFLVDPLQHAWQIPFVAVLFPGGLALFIAGACATAAWQWREGWPRVFLLAATYGLAEWLRGHVLTGFPWNIPAYGWGAFPSVLQSVSVIGSYGLSVLTILLGTTFALLFDRRAREHALIPSAFVLVFVIVGGAGSARLATTPTANVPGVELRIVQPDVPQAQKYLPSDRARNWRRLILLSIEKRKGPKPTHIIWPEAAPPFLLAREPEALDDIAMLTGSGTVLMTGAVRVQFVPGQEPHYFNSFYIFGPGGKLLATYDKFHLVPLGEYVPLKGLLGALGIDKLVNQPGGFDSGQGPETIAVPGAPDVGPLICYEILFPGAVTAAKRPGWLVNVTDDSWFGPPSSTGPRQHFLTARVRAIEEGLPVARAANTGISAVIDPLGRVVASLGMGKMGVVDAPLPAALPVTVFHRFGDAAYWLFVLVCLGLGLFARRRRPGS